MKIKKFLMTIIASVSLILLVGCQNNANEPKTLRMAEAINSSTERVWFICYTPQNKKINSNTEVGGVLVTKDAKITAYVTAAAHKTLRNFNSKKNNDELINYAKKLSKQGSIGSTNKNSIIKKASKVNLYMDMTGEKVAGEGIVGITAPGYFMTQTVNKTKIDDFNYAGLKDPMINGGTGQNAYYMITRLDNPQQKFAFDRTSEKNTSKVYMKSYPKGKSKKSSTKPSSKSASSSSQSTK